MTTTTAPTYARQHGIAITTARKRLEAMVAEGKATKRLVRKTDKQSDFLGSFPATSTMEYTIKE